ncbi:interferon-induced GTP-binding protein Mx2-like isoform X2 [Hyperolius riggenbachi]|uniref:interferon-induced GTP-binding protein Mx2-like isoform X2 n=1 Tax=Hyperolius riggenbachi TaxID=752182 RepID=UPI0035A286B7
MAQWPKSFPKPSLHRNPDLKGIGVIHGLTPDVSAGFRSPPNKPLEENLLANKFEDKIRPCIDLIDSLRSLGVDKDLPLPAIAVIGDQSSGKSSVLEALSGVSLPRGNGIVTRCPLELKLKKNPEWLATISYRNKKQNIESALKVEQAVRMAQDSLVGTGKGISDELITLEVFAPNVPDLTLIDLPGITRIALPNQPINIGKQIKQIIKKYITRQETINLVVVPGNVDIATAEALEMAQEVDPNGERTIGVITKPDLVDRGAEKEVLKTVRNEAYCLTKGYMMVKCRGQREIQNNLSLQDSLKNEKTFFEEHDEFSTLMRDGLATIPILADKLTSELVAHIFRSLPNVGHQIRSKLQSAEDELNIIGMGVPDSDDDKLQFLATKIKAFSSIITRVVNGEIEGNSEDLKLFKNLRALFSEWEKMMKNSNSRFVKELEDKGIFYEERCRGRELQGFINYPKFEDIVRMQTHNYEAPAISLLHCVKELVLRCFKNEASQCFEQFKNLHSSAVDKVENISLSQEREAANALKLQFKMENVIFCQDTMYCKSLMKVKSGGVSINGMPMHDPNQPSREELLCHLQAYLKVMTYRLSNQIPLIIQYFVLRDYADKLQDQMMLLLQSKQYTVLLEETNELSQQRQQLKNQKRRLSLALERLNKFSRYI